MNSHSASGLKVCCMEGVLSGNDLINWVWCLMTYIMAKVCMSCRREINGPRWSSVSVKSGHTMLTAWALSAPDSPRENISQRSTFWQRNWIFDVTFCRISKVIDLTRPTGRLEVKRRKLCAEDNYLSKPLSKISHITLCIIQTVHRFL